LAQLFKEGKSAAFAPEPSKVLSEYTTLLSGNERKKQKKLGIWTRFQIADGFFPGLARLLIACAIVGFVLSLEWLASSVATVSVYNGLARTVNIKIDNQNISLQPYTTQDVKINIEYPHMIITKTEDGKTIETFYTPMENHAQHYIYNVAEASPLIMWAAPYGNAIEEPKVTLGVPRWMTSVADIHFQKPPVTVNLTEGGAIRWVISGVGEILPEKILDLITSKEDRKKVISVHAKWDAENSIYYNQWQELAKKSGK
jgi:hypothetical protein